MITILQIEPTTRCSGGCKYCDREGIHPRDLTVKTLTRILNEHPDTRTVRLHGLGEPFLHPSLYPLCKEIHDREIVVDIVTNGGRIEPHTIQDYVDLLLFSIDTMDPGKYREIRGDRIPLETVLANLAIAAGMETATVGINQVKTPEVTTRDILEVSRYCKDRGLIHILNPLQVWRPTGPPPETAPLCEWMDAMAYYDAEGHRHPCCLRKGDEYRVDEGASLFQYCGGCDQPRAKLVKIL